MTWECRQPSHHLSFLFAHSFDWDTKKDTRTKIVTRTLRGEEVGGRHSSKCWTWLTGLPFGIIRQAPSPLHEQSVVRVIPVGLISNKTIRQSKQIVSRKPHILKNTELQGMYYHQFVLFQYVSTAFQRLGRAMVSILARCSRVKNIHSDQASLICPRPKLRHPAISYQWLDIASYLSQRVLNEVVACTVNG